MSTVAYLCTDLLFTSKSRETAHALGHTAIVSRDPAALLEAARAADLVIIDLRRPDALAALDGLRADPVAAEVHAVGFCDHERTDLMAEAGRRGCTAYAKGKFSSELRHLLAADGPPAGAAGDHRAR